MPVFLNMFAILKENGAHLLCQKLLQVSNATQRSNQTDIVTLDFPIIALFFFLVPRGFSLAQQSCKTHANTFSYFCQPSNLVHIHRGKRYVTTERHFAVVKDSVRGIRYAKCLIFVLNRLK